MFYKPIIILCWHNVAACFMTFPVKVDSFSNVLLLFGSILLLTSHLSLLGFSTLCRTRVLWRDSTSQAWEPNVQPTRDQKQLCTWLQLIRSSPNEPESVDFLLKTRVKPWPCWNGVEINGFSWKMPWGFCSWKGPRSRGWAQLQVHACGIEQSQPTDLLALTDAGIGQPRRIGCCTVLDPFVVSETSAVHPHLCFLFVPSKRRKANSRTYYDSLLMNKL